MTGYSRYRRAIQGKKPSLWPAIALVRAAEIEATLALPVVSEKKPNSESPGAVASGAFAVYLSAQIIL